MRQGSKSSTNLSVDGVHRRGALTALATASLAGLGQATAAADAEPASSSGQTLRLASSSFEVDIDAASGGVLAITCQNDPARMSWTSGPDNAPWHRLDALWGLGFADAGPERLHRARWGRPTQVAISDSGVVVTYRIGALQLVVERGLVADSLHERYVFTNVGKAPLDLGGSEGKLAIYAPFNDSYTSTSDVLENRAHAHVWAGGATSWVALLRMGGRAPHLGLVVTEGGLDSYSIDSRDKVTGSNTRGAFLLHPSIDVLAPGQSRVIAWTLFWHGGWEDFFTQALKRSSQMVVVDAAPWTTVGDEDVVLKFFGDLGPRPVLAVESRSMILDRSVLGWSASLPRARAERLAVLRYSDGLESRIMLNAAPPLDELIGARVRFIVGRQQWTKTGDPWDGAYIVYDNETDVMVREDRGPASDRNDGRERLAMGVLVARWLRQVGSGDVDLRPSLDRYYAFVRTQLQRSDGYVLDGAGRDRKRLYNWPWVMQLHLEMAALTGEQGPLDLFMLTLESFYREGGVAFYPIGLPVDQGLSALRQAGRSADHDKALAWFTGHGEALAGRGTRYPASEVNFEQSIIAPAALILLELHAATNDETWLRAAKPHLALLDLIEGRQPDHRLNGVSIRHWDGYWFGKSQMWGDTFPHYWSSLNALAWEYLAKATGEMQWRRRAQTTLRANLSLFTPDGRASAAFIYPKTVNGRAGGFADAYANDQDWALVHALKLREVSPNAF